MGKWNYRPSRRFRRRSPNPPSIFYDIRAPLPGNFFFSLLCFYFLIFFNSLHFYNDYVLYLFRIGNGFFENIVKEEDLSLLLLCELSVRIYTVSVD